MKTYKVHAAWDATGWWIVTAPELGPAATTQCKRLDHADASIREVIELLTDVTDHALDLEWEDPSPAAREARRLRAEAEATTRAAHHATRVAVAELRDAGLSYRDIGMMTGISYQRAQQLATSDP